MSMAYLYLLAGLLLFLGVHSTRVFADDWRNQTRERLGALPFKGIYSLISLAGFVLLVWGYGVARQQPVVLWNPPVAMRHVAALLTLFAFVRPVRAPTGRWPGCRCCRCCRARGPRG